MQTRGLSDEQASQLMYLVCCVADSFDAEYESECNVPKRTLRLVYPEFNWR